MDGGEEVYNEIATYKIVNDYLAFKIEKNLFKIKTINPFHLIKSSDSSTLSIVKEDEKMRAYVKVKAEGIDLEYEIKVLNFDCKESNREIIITYLLESDMEKEKSIILKWIK